MKERPILFSAPMVLALLAGTKTQTRRAINGFDRADIEPRDGYWIATGDRPTNYDGEVQMNDWSKQLRCPYGEPGDRLWVREAHYCIGETREAFYRATGGWSELQPPMQWTGPWKPSIHMPRWASRILLEVTDVRVQRLQDISTSDCWAEGIPSSPDVDPRHEYADLWESINGPCSWGCNPWVWAVSFKRIAP